VAGKPDDGTVGLISIKTATVHLYRQLFFFRLILLLAANMVALVC